MLQVSHEPIPESELPRVSLGWRRLARDGLGVMIALDEARPRAPAMAVLLGVGRSCGRES